MDIRNLTTFVQVAELGSFSRAAERLGYSQPTVSVQILNSVPSSLSFLRSDRLSVWEGISLYLYSSAVSATNSASNSTSPLPRRTPTKVPRCAAGSSTTSSRSRSRRCARLSAKNTRSNSPLKSEKRLLQ